MHAFALRAHPLGKRYKTNPQRGVRGADIFEGFVPVDVQLVALYCDESVEKSGLIEDNATRLHEQKSEIKNEAEGKRRVYALMCLDRCPNTGQMGDRHMDIKKVTVAGGGVLGSQIAFQTAYQGYEVTIWLRSEGSVGRAQDKIDSLHARYLDMLETMRTDKRAWGYGLAPKDYSPEDIDGLKAKADKAHATMKLTTDWDEAFADADLVIEAVAEDPAQKKAFYQQLAGHLGENTIVCTNSSTLLPSMFASDTGRPEKYLALHFANEIWRMPSAEIMPHAGTDMHYVDEVADFAASIRMVPLKIMKEQPGYLLNSLLVPLLGAGLSLWASDISDPETIDRAWTLGTGSNAGPFHMMDVVGLTTVYNVFKMNPGAEKPGTVQHEITTRLSSMIEAGKLGMARGEGFFKYEK